jgi:hypothetical protein
MVCNRCFWAVERELKKLGLKPLKVVLDEAVVEDPVDKEILHHAATTAI